MPSYTEEPPRYASSALGLSDSLLSAIARLAKSIASDIAKTEQRTIVTDDDMKSGIERAIREIDAEIAKPVNHQRVILDVINALADRYVSK